jgi:hypothetical protein
MRNIFSRLLVFVFAFFSSSQAAWFGFSDPDASDVTFGNFNQKEYSSGDQLSFKIKIEHSRHRDEYTSEETKVFVIRSRVGRNTEYEVTGAKITAIDGKKKSFTVSGTVPDVEKKGKYYILIRGPGILGSKTIADSRFSKLKFWRWFYSRRYIKISPSAAGARPEEDQPEEDQPEKYQPEEDQPEEDQPAQQEDYNKDGQMDE